MHLLLQTQSLTSTNILSHPTFSLIVNRHRHYSFTPPPQLHHRRRRILPLKCSLSITTTAVPAAAQSSLNLSKPEAAEVSRTIMELSSVGTLSTLTQDGWPLGVGVRFAVSKDGAPVLCLDQSNKGLFGNNNNKSTLHVKLKQCGMRTPQCTIRGSLEKPDDTMVIEQLHSTWIKRFGKEVDGDLLYVVDVESVYQMEDFEQEGVWVSSLDYKNASPDPLRDFAERIVDEINSNNIDDINRFCNIYADLDFKVLEAKMIWVDRLGFDLRLRSEEGIFDVRIPFPREVTDEKGAKSSFNGMSQSAWEVEKNFYPPNFTRVKQLKQQPHATTDHPISASPPWYHCPPLSEGRPHHYYLLSLITGESPSSFIRTQHCISCLALPPSPISLFEQYWSYRFHLRSGFVNYPTSIMKDIVRTFIFFLVILYLPIRSNCEEVKKNIDVGVILDMNTSIGKMSNDCLSMGLTDFYSSHEYTTKIILHLRDSGSDIVDAASAAIDLLKNIQVKVIIGPQRSTQADFIVDLGNKSQIPVISFTATSPFLSHRETPYFIRTSSNDLYQVKAIVTIVKNFNWREIVPIYEDTNYGNGIVPYLSEALQEIGTRLPYRSVISPLDSDDRILQEMYKLMTMQTRVFFVHMRPSLARRVFLKAKLANMIRKGYAWIISDGIVSEMDNMGSSVIDAMVGVLGVKPYIPSSNELVTEKLGGSKLNSYCLRAYDSIQALAMAVQNVGPVDSSFKKQENVTGLADIGVSEIGPTLLQSILNTKFEGLSGYFQLINGELQSSGFQVINLVGRNENGRIKYATSKKLSYYIEGNDTYSISKDYLGDIKWPGESTIVPKGWEIPTSKEKLKVGVPIKKGFTTFVSVGRNPQTNEPKVDGFCIEVFEEVMKSLPYYVPYEYVSFEISDGRNYDELVKMVYNQSVDAVVGDITILEKRFSLAEFTLPFTESGVSMVVPVNDHNRKNAWIFMKPLTVSLWVTTGAFFIFTGFVVWVLEHQKNEEFRGPRHKQVGTIFWFSFSTLVFAHRERILSNLTRFVMIIWIFVVLVLTSSYTASLTSMLTVEQLQPTVNNIDDLIKSGEYIGYQMGSFVPTLLKKLKVDESKLKEYHDLEEYEEALAKGSKNGGVGAIVDELPYIRLLLAKYCTKYIMVGPTYKTAGMGFAFQKGSPLVHDVSKAVLTVTEGDKITKITEKWLGESSNCDDAIINSNSLSLDSFKGLFLIAGLSSISALLIFLFTFLRENKQILQSKDLTISQKLSAMAKAFSGEKQGTSHDVSLDETDVIDNEASEVSGWIELSQVCTSDGAQSPAVIVSDHDDGFLSQDEGGPLTEPRTPYRDLVLGIPNNSVDKHDFVPQPSYIRFPQYTARR
ncbi:hypothetical protein ACFE04_031618 [Oxalis oulophora]